MWKKGGREKEREGEGAEEFSRKTRERISRVWRLRFEIVFKGGYS